MVAEIADLVHPKPILFDNVYEQQVLVIGSQHVVFDNPDLPEPAPLRATTLSAVVDYMTHQIADSDYEVTVRESACLVVHVVSPSDVRVVAPLVGNQRQQFLYLHAVPDLPMIGIGPSHDIEPFLVQLMSCFVETPDRLELQQFCSQLRLGLAREIEDNGVAQTVTVQNGMTRTSDVRVKNPWRLAPYRSFPEIEQPASDYLLRMQQKQVGDTLAAQARLIEADGGAWRAEAVRRIGTWLRERLPAGTVVIA
jgi:hypothetical protein